MSRSILRGGAPSSSSAICVMAKPPPEYPMSTTLWPGSSWAMLRATFSRAVQLYVVTAPNASSRLGEHEDAWRYGVAVDPDQASEQDEYFHHRGM